ncbi:hypothetical protein [Arsukibacterium indicum]|uniref:Uncharacterized protein n=1 Tax=Arsukibacterium indicum TaxID=2848612 RepID=A0ABS6MNI9_9GAMM|nr:hypothetical protein [Arsukibacterium indicum]MBV2130370.1 hypothetical protein [Arsukibacterium indicum]
MLSVARSNDIKVPYEEEINGFTIYIEDNPDRWCGGYIWSVSKNESEVESGLEFSAVEAFKQVHTYVLTLITVP